MITISAFPAPSAVKKEPASKKVTVLAPGESKPLFLKNVQSKLKAQLDQDRQLYRQHQAARKQGIQEYLREASQRHEPVQLSAAVTSSQGKRPPPPMSSDWTSTLSPAHPVYRTGRPSVAWQRQRTQPDATVQPQTALAISETFLHGPLLQAFADDLPSAVASVASQGPSAAPEAAAPVADALDSSLVHHFAAAMDAWGAPATRSDNRFQTLGELDKEV